MGELVNKETQKNVDAFMKKVSPEVRKSDGYQVIEIMKRITGHQPKVWGKNIIAFGKYKYKRKDGKEFEWFKTGLNPSKAHLSIYLMFDVSAETEFLEKLGPHKCGKGCLYIKKLEQIDLKVLERMIEKSNNTRVGH